MKSLFSLPCLFIAFCLSAQSGCLDAEKLMALDAQWERALLENDAEVLEELLADDFIWVHNHAGTVDDKAKRVAAAKRAKANNRSNTRSRTQREVKTLILGSTGVVTGFTVVDRGPTPTTYNFMRTYALVDGSCKLLANHTMAIPKDE
ncbi:MAG: nuclear transport factor 2 family protein [Bacteroidota bacterium]